MTREEFTGELKKLVWTKGDYKFVPYGILWGSMVYESQRTIPGEYPIYVQSPEQFDGDGYYFDAQFHTAWD